MKTIILSVRPPWARLLVTSKKTVELRKQRLPGDGDPVRALIYETKSGGGCGALIGEVVFYWSICERMWVSIGERDAWLGAACVTDAEAKTYADGRMLFGWARSRCGPDPIEYDTPRPIDGRPPQSWRWA